MDHFNYNGDQLFAEDVPLDNIAEQFGTPCYVYSRATLERHWHAFDKALGDHPHLICYAVKANSNIALLNLFARLGSGFDVVSIGELQRVIKAGGDPKKVVFSGVAKTHDEMREALEIGIHCFNVESESELFRLQDIAKSLNKKAPVSLRINPDVDAKTHPYIATGLKENKFGIDIQDAKRLYKEAKELSNINVIGVDCHIGSQLTELAPFLDALDHLLVLVDELEAEGIHIDHVDLGGGLGVRYKDETPPHPREHAAALVEKLKDRDLTIILEPGRAIAANAGVLLTKVEYLKSNQDKHFAIVDAAMNDLLRPALYQAWQDIIPVDKSSNKAAVEYDIVGPICETGDFLGKARSLSIDVGDLLVVRTAGAYGFCMSSNYNSRPRAAEVMVDGDKAHLIRKRETLEDLYAHEQLMPL